MAFTRDLVKESKFMKIINLFVSHYGGDEDKIDAVKNLLCKAGYQVRDGSIKESEPNHAKDEAYIKQRIMAPQIQWAGCMVVLIGPKTASREWVDWEIEYAMKKGKRIVGVFLQGAIDSDIPQALLEYGNALVGWNSGKIAEAISGKNVWLKTDNTERPENASARLIC